MRESESGTGNGDGDVVEAAVKDSLGPAQIESPGPYKQNVDLLRRSQRTRRTSLHESSNNRSLSPDSSSFNSSLHAGGRVQGDAVVWDWEAPSLSTNVAGISDQYEPQGELLDEANKQRILTEFSIPGRVDTTGLVDIPLAPVSTNNLKRRASTDLGEVGPTRQKPLTFDMGGDVLSSRPAAAEDKRQRSSVDEQALRVDSTSLLPLPARKVFPIQIGDKLFRLSGASISSDAPSYFSQFFEEQLQQDESAESVRTLYIDRDPSTFGDISLHLQGYHIEPRDGAHFVKLFADAQFFSLPRLTSQLFSCPIYITIGSTPFQIPRDLFSAPGNSPNYFTLGFQIFFTNPSDVFPGLVQRSLLRPPSILPPSVPNRSAEIFADLLLALKGYTLEIRSDEHRAALLRDARYYHLKGLEQTLIPHRLSYDAFRRRWEICMRLEDVRQSGISFIGDEYEDPEVIVSDSKVETFGQVYYSRPYVDEEAHALVLEINDEAGAMLRPALRKQGHDGTTSKIQFFGQTLARITKLIDAVKSRLDSMRNFDILGLDENDELGVSIGVEASISLDGSRSITGLLKGVENDCGNSMKKDIVMHGQGPCGEWLLKRSQWRLKAKQTGVHGKIVIELYLEAVKIEAFTCERARNDESEFL